MGIHNNQQGLGSGVAHGVVGRRKDGVFELFVHIVDQLTCHGGVLVDDDLAIALEGLLHNALHADRRTHAVEVGKAVSHDIDLVRIGNGTADGVGNDAHAHLADLFRRRCSAAEEFIGVVLDDRNLIAAASECHFERLAGVELTLADGLAAPRQSDGNRRDMTRGSDGTHVLEYREPLRHDFVDIGVAEDDHIAVVADFLVHRLILVRPALEIRLQRDRDGGVILLGACHKVLGVVKGDQRYARNGRVVLAHRAFIVGVFDEVADRRVIRRHAVNGKFPAVDGDVDAVAVDNIAVVVAGYIVVDVVALGTAPSDRLAEARVAPRDIAFGSHDRDGIFIPLQILAVDAVDPVGGALDDAADIGAEAQAQHKHHRRSGYGDAQLRIKDGHIVVGGNRRHQQHDCREDDKPRRQHPVFLSHVYSFCSVSRKQNASAW